MNEFLTACALAIHLQKYIFGKTLIEVFIPNLYASFGPYCVQIGQVFTTQWDLKHSEELRNRPQFPSTTAICQFSNILQRLTVPPIIERFGCERCQKKHKGWGYQLLWGFFKNILMYINWRQSKIRSLYTSVIHRMVYFERYCISFIAENIGFIFWSFKWTWNSSIHSTVMYSIDHIQHWNVHA